MSSSQARGQDEWDSRPPLVLCPSWQEEGKNPAPCPSPQAQALQPPSCAGQSHQNAGWDEGKEKQRRGGWRSPVPRAAAALGSLGSSSQDPAVPSLWRLHQPPLCRELCDTQTVHRGCVGRPSHTTASPLARPPAPASAADTDPGSPQPATCRCNAAGPCPGPLVHSGPGLWGPPARALSPETPPTISTDLRELNILCSSTWCSRGSSKATAMLPSSAQGSDLKMCAECSVGQWCSGHRKDRNGNALPHELAGRAGCPPRLPIGISFRPLLHQELFS